MTPRLTRVALPAMLGFRIAVACGVLIGAVIVAVLGLAISGVVR